MFNIATTDILQVGCTVTIPSSGLGTLLGYQVGTYPPTEPMLVSNTYQTGAAYTGGSTEAPQVNSVIAVCLRCSVVNYLNSIPSDFIANKSILSSFDIPKEDHLDKKAAILGKRKGKSITGGLLMADSVAQQSAFLIHFDKKYFICIII